RAQRATHDREGAARLQEPRADRAADCRDEGTDCKARGRQGEARRPGGGAWEAARRGGRPPERTRTGDGGPGRRGSETTQGETRWASNPARPRGGRNRDLEGGPETDPPRYGDANKERAKVQRETD